MHSDPSASKTVTILWNRAKETLQRGELEQTEDLLWEIIEKAPNHTEANAALGNLALQAGFPEEALSFLEKALIAGPDPSPYLRTVLEALEKIPPAKADDYVFALLAQQPQLHALRISCARKLLQNKNFPAAEKLLREGWHLKNKESGELLAFYYLREKRLAEALPVWQQLSSIDPANCHYLAALADTCHQLGRTADCVRINESLRRQSPQDALVLSRSIALASSDQSPGRLRQLMQQWEQSFGKPAVSLPAVQPRDPGSRGPFRVGFLSTTFFHHANGHFLLPLLKELRAKGVTLFAYHDSSFEDDITRQYRDTVSAFRTIAGIPAGNAAEIIRKDQLDLLIDINAHFDSQRLRILTYRPAPVQAHYLGGTTPTGLSCMDWWFVDDLTEDPRDPEPFSGEKRYFLEGGLHAFQPLRPAASPNPLPALEKGHVTFGSLTALHKIHPPVVKLWGETLRAVPGSRFILGKEIFRDSNNRRCFLDYLQNHDFPTDQIDLHPIDSKSLDDLSFYHRIDIALDTFPYTGITTTCEALWMGVPVITLEGNCFVAREAAGLLKRVGLHDCVAPTPEGFIAQAGKLAGDWKTLRDLRLRLRDRVKQSPIGDPARLADSFYAFLKNH